VSATASAYKRIKLESKMTALSKENKALLFRLVKTVRGIIKKANLVQIESEYLGDNDEGWEVERGNYTLEVHIENGDEQVGNTVSVRIQREGEHSNVWASFGPYDSGQYGVLWSLAPKDHLFHDFNGKYPADTASENVFYDFIHALVARFMRIPKRK